MTPGGPGLVAVPAEISFTEGAGVLDSYLDLREVLADPGADADEIVGVSAPAVLDLLGAAMNPTSALTQGTVGWLLEHVGFLNEFLDQLAGDPAEVIAQAQTWHRVARELAAVAEEHRIDVDTLPGWDGAAASAYRSAVTTHVQGLGNAATDALEVSDRILTAGALVATVRGLVRDVIAELVDRLILWAVAAMATAVVTAGASAAAYAAAAVTAASTTAVRILTRIAELLDELGTAARGVSDTVERIGRTAEMLSRAGAVPGGGVSPVLAAQVAGAASPIAHTAGAVADSAAGLAAGARGAVEPISDLSRAAATTSDGLAQVAAPVSRPGLLDLDSTLAAAAQAAVPRVGPELLKQQEQAEAAPRDWERVVAENR